MLILVLGTDIPKPGFSLRLNFLGMAKKRTVMALNRPAAATLHSPHLARIHLQLKLASCLF